VYIQNKPQFACLRGLTSGVVFLGTPHSGSGSATIGTIITNIAKVALQSPADQLMNELKPDSPELERLSLDFRQLHDQLRLISFYEQKPMKLGLVSRPL
jgi:hypothetical protein